MPSSQNHPIRVPGQPTAGFPSQKRALALPISQVAFFIEKKNAPIASVQREILRWMAKRAGRPLPEQAWNGEAFELEEIGAQHAEVCTLKNPHFWAARLDDADKLVPSRTWVTEVALAEREDDTIAFGARLTAVIRGGEGGFDRSLPGFVRQICSKYDAYLDDFKLSEEPWLISSSEDVKDLVSLICNKNRVVDVIVAATAENSSDVSTAAIDTYDVAKRVVGAAHVAIITGDASFALSDIFGREYSVFRQAVRTYKPKFDPDQDEPFAHPLCLPHRIQQWPNGGPAAFQRLLCSQALIRTVTNFDLEGGVPSFLAVKRAATRLQFEQARQGGQFREGTACALRKRQ